MIFHSLKQSIISIKNVFEDNIPRHVDTTRPFYHDNESLEIMLILVVAANTSEAIYDNDLEFASDDTIKRGNILRTGVLNRLFNVIIGSKSLS